MNLFLIGIDYQRADIAQREDIWRRQKEIIGFFYDRKIEAIVFSTCNRFEIFASGQLPQEVPAILKDGYILCEGTEILRHALRVAVGLESQLKGELQILQQLSQWIEMENFPVELRAFWEKVIRQARIIRYLSGLNDAGQNIANVIFGFVKQRLENPPVEVIVLGTGKAAQLFALNKPEWVALNFVSRKYRLKAELLSGFAKGMLFNYSQLDYLLTQADVLVSAASSPHYLITKERLIKAINLRTKPLYIFDLGLPRNIEPHLRAIEGVYLYDLDSINSIIAEYNYKIAGDLLLAERLVEEYLYENITVGHEEKSFSPASG